jgi:hypothetical protein
MYRENSHAYHTCDSLLRETACFQAPETTPRVGSIPIARSTSRLASGRVGATAPPPNCDFAMLTIDDQTAIEVPSVRPLTRHRLSAGAMVALGWSLALSAHAATPLTESCPVAVYPGANWKSVEPAGAGWSREKLNAARDYSASIHSSSVMILEHGVVIDEWGDVAKKISSYSVRKSLNRLRQGQNTWGMNSRRDALWVAREAEHGGNCKHRRWLSARFFVLEPIQTMA